MSAAGLSRRRISLVLFLGLLAPASSARADLQPSDISPAGIDASRPLIATDGSGDLVAVWRESDGDSVALRAAVRPSSGDWSSQRLADSNGAELPALAMDRQGNAVVAWQQPTKTGSVVRAAVRPAGGNWTQPDDLSAPGEPGFGPNVDAQAGTIGVVWVAIQKRRAVVLSSLRRIDGAWAPAELVAGPVGNPRAPAIALDDHGGAVAAWTGSDGVYRLVQAATRRADGQWSEPTILSSTGHSASAPKVVADAGGRAAVGWIRSNGDWSAAQIASRTADGTWSAPADLSTRGGDARALDLATSRDGHMIAAWRQGDPNADLWTSSRPPDTNHWGSPAAMTSNWSGARADVTIDENGNATAAWAGSSALVSASFKPVGQAWQDDYLLSSYDDSSVTPAVAARLPEKATAVWIKAGDANDRIESVDYDIDTSAKEAASEDDSCEACGDDSGGDGSDEGARFMGTAGPDRLVGTPGNDVFFGRGGNDTIIGRGGRDVIFGGAGDDRILGGSGADRLYGDAGRDTILGGRAGDLLSGGAGRDDLVGGHGSDVLIGGAGRDFLRAGAGNDVLRGKDGLRDRVNGGRGLDRYRLDRWLDRAVSIESRLERARRRGP